MPREYEVDWKVAAEIDDATGALKRDSVTCIADRDPGAEPGLTISNVGAYEDRIMAELVVHALRIQPQAWRANTHEYRLLP